MSSDLELSSDSFEQTSTDEEEFENKKDEYSKKTNGLEDSLRSKRFRSSSSRNFHFFLLSLQLSRNYSIGNACYAGLLEHWRNGHSRIRLKNSENKQKLF